MSADRERRRAAAAKDRREALVLAFCEKGVDFAAAIGASALALTQKACVYRQSLGGDRDSHDFPLNAPDGQAPSFIAAVDALYGDTLAELSSLVRAVASERRATHVLTGTFRADLFLAAREAAAIQAVRGRLAEAAAGRRIVAALPRNRVLELAMAMVGIDVHTLESPPEAALSPTAAVEGSTLYTGRRGEAALIDLFGIPDPFDRLKEVAHLVRGPLIVSYHRHHCGPMDLLAEVIASIPGTIPLPHLGIAEVSAAGAAPAAQVGEIGDTAFARRVTPLIGSQIAADARIAETLAGVAERFCVTRLFISEHVSPSSPLLLDMAMQADADIEIFAHGAWPIPPQMRVDPPAVGGGWSRAIYRPWLASREDDQLSGQTPAPPGRFRRTWRVAARESAVALRSLVCATRPSGGRRIGLFLTSGQDHLAADTDVRRLREGLRAWARGLEGAPHRRLSVRLREASDSLDYHRSMLTSWVGPRQLTLHRVGEMPMARFLAAQDVVVDFGHPSSAVLEAFAVGVPVFRMPTGAPPRFELLAREVVPTLTGSDPWTEVEERLAEPGAARRLATAQRAWLRWRISV